MAFFNQTSLLRLFSKLILLNLIHNEIDFFDKKWENIRVIFVCRVFFGEKILSSRKEYTFFHTADTTRVGKEVLFFSDNIVVPKVTFLTNV